MDGTCMLCPGAAGHSPSSMLAAGSVMQRSTSVCIQGMSHC
jgi:hypothetical protein